MNRAIFTLLVDYHRRTLGAWALVVFVQLMQTSVIWTLGNDHLPIVGAVIATLVFCSTWDSPHLVIRTLPIKARELALLRWWERIAMPMLFITLGYVLAWFSNRGSAFPTPPFLDLWKPISASLATLASLSVMPLPMLSAQRSKRSALVVVGIAMSIAGLYGLPMEWLPEPLPSALLTCGALLALASLGLARSGRVLQMPWPVLAATAPGRNTPIARLHFRGWPVLVMQWTRTTLLLAFASIVVISLIRPHVHFLEQTLPWIFVSVTGAAGTILGRRWLSSGRSLQCLPMRSSTLALIVCLALMAPMVITSLLATAVNAVVPGWGISIPLYMVPVFAIVPALEISWYNVQTSHPVASSVQQWSPIMQVVAWPLWTGSVMSLALTRLFPAWFEVIAVGTAVVLAGVAYIVVLVRIRSGMALERIGDPLTPR